MLTGFLWSKKKSLYILQPDELSSFLEEWKRELISQRNYEPSKKILQSSVYQPCYPEHQPHYYEDNTSSTVMLGYKRETPLLDDDTGPPKKQYHQTIDDQLTDLTIKLPFIIESYHFHTFSF